MVDKVVSKSLNAFVDLITISSGKGMRRVCRRFQVQVPMEIHQFTYQKEIKKFGQNENLKSFQSAKAKLNFKLENLFVSKFCPIA